MGLYRGHKNRQRMDCERTYACLCARFAISFFSLGALSFCFPLTSNSSGSEPESASASSSSFSESLRALDLDKDC